MTATSKRVLVVDDEDVVCRSYERVLTQAGFEVGKAHSGPEALAEVRAGDYDVMLADLKMPGMDGLQVVEKLRGTHPQMPVVVITGYPSQDTLQAAARLGVTDYLTKPVAPDVLKQATMQAMAAQWTGPVLWPEHPVAVPERPEARAKVEPEAAPTVQKRKPGRVDTAVRLALAPVVSLAYVMFLPFLGFAMFLGLGAKAIARKLGGQM